MAKFIINPNFQILKSCRTSDYLKTPEVELPCPTMATVAKENFLENIDREIVFIDDSIEIPRKPVADKEEDLNVVDGRERHEQTCQSETSRCDLALQRVRDVAGVLAANTDGLHPKPLSAQISLPIKDFHSLSFYDVLMLSQGFKGKESDKIIPRHGEIEETGSACIMAEKCDGNMIVYVAIQRTLEDGHVTQETLSVVDDNLKMMHEKQIERSCVGGIFTVAAD